MPEFTTKPATCYLNEICDLFDDRNGAMDKLYKELYYWTLSHYYKKDEQTTEDEVQESIAIFLNKIKNRQIRYDIKPIAYIKKIIKYRCLNRIKENRVYIKKKYRTEGQSEYGDFKFVAVDLIDLDELGSYEIKLIETDEDAVALITQLHRHPKLKDCLELMQDKVLSSLTFKEIAEDYSTSENAIKVKYSRCREKLKGILEDVSNRIRKF